jgi:hypothetical protein
MSMVKLIGIAAIAASLGGCVPSDFIVMKNPTTGELRECKTNSGSSLFPIVQTLMDKSSTHSCAAGYQAAGWQRMN